MFGEVELAGPVLPFDKPAPASKDPLAAALDGAPGMAANPKPAPNPLASTMALDPEELAKLRAKLALPFEASKRSPSSPPPAATPFEASKRSPSTPPPAAGAPTAPGGSPRTMAMPAVDVAPEPAPPGGKPVAKRAMTPQLTVEQLAALVEDLGGAPNPAAVLARHGLTAEQFQALEQQWTAHVRQSPGDLQRLALARETYRAAKRGRR